MPDTRLPDPQDPPHGLVLVNALCGYLPDLPRRVLWPRPARRTAIGSRTGNRRINRALHIMAIVQIRHDTGRAHIRREVAAGKTKMEALRGSIGDCATWSIGSWSRT